MSSGCSRAGRLAACVARPGDGWRRSDPRIVVSHFRMTLSPIVSAPPPGSSPARRTSRRMQPAMCTSRTRPTIASRSSPARERTQSPESSQVPSCRLRLKTQDFEHQMRLAAIDRKLQAHQDGYTRWRRPPLESQWRLSSGARSKFSCSRSRSVVRLAARLVFTDLRRHPSTAAGRRRRAARAIVHFVGPAPYVRACAGSRSPPAARRRPELPAPPG